MKKFALILGLSASLFSCSLLQRHDAEGEVGDADEVRDMEPQDGPLFDASGNEVGSEGPAKAASYGRVDSEVAKMNTKIAALETKVDVLTASLERVQAERSQPVIHAEARPQPTMAAPVEVPTEIEEPAAVQVSAAPAKPATLPVMIKGSEKASAVASGAERDFRAAMQMFQNGRNLEAASRFALVAKKYPNHLLASHALYWSGEANARGQQMGLAGDAWAELEKQYPRSAYLPEALAGLAKAHEAQGDSAKASHYRALLLRSFPKSPVALRMESTGAPVARVTQPEHASRPAAIAAPGEEDVPLFEGEDDQASSPDVESQ